MSAYESAIIVIDLIFQEERIIKKAEFETNLTGYDAQS